MTRTDLSNFRRLEKLLRKSADLADAIDAQLGNGGEIGAIVGSMADEIEVKLFDELRTERKSQ